jgi:hypothetical protein
VFLRTLLLTVAIGASLAIAGVAAAPAKDDFPKFTFPLGPVPPLTQTTIEMTCTQAAEGRHGRYDCHNSGGPNPNPPKDTTSLRFGADQGGPFTITAYPDGQVTLIGRFKLPKGCTSLLSCL